MKPFTSGSVIAAWLLRIMLVWFVYQHHFKPFTNFDLNSFSFYIHAAYLLFAVLLLAGGLMQKQALTVISGLFLFVIPIVQLIRVFPEDLSGELLLYLIPMSVGFCFFTGGNNQ